MRLFMPRIRSIKPTFPQSESMGRVSRDARLLFILLWTMADDEGRLRGNADMLASSLYPYDRQPELPELIEVWLDELAGGDDPCIQRYAVNGSHYVLVRHWSKHQKMSRSFPSSLPPPIVDNAAPPASSPPQKPRSKSAKNDTPEGPPNEPNGKAVESESSDKVVRRSVSSTDTSGSTHECVPVGMGMGVMNGNGSGEKPRVRANKPRDAVLPEPLPDWIPLDAWTGFVDMRQRIHKPLTAHAVQLAIGKLASLMRDGSPPREVLERSTFNAWTGLWPIDHHEKRNNAPRTDERSADRKRAFDELTGRPGNAASEAEVFDLQPEDVRHVTTHS
jgi:hypothetical protein